MWSAASIAEWLGTELRSVLNPHIVRSAIKQTIVHASVFTLSTVLMLPHLCLVLRPMPLLPRPMFQLRRLTRNSRRVASRRTENHGILITKIKKRIHVPKKRDLEREREHERERKRERECERQRQQERD